MINVNFINLIAWVSLISAQATNEEQQQDARIAYQFGLCPGHTGYICQDGNPSAYAIQSDCTSYTIGCQYERIVSIEMLFIDPLPVVWSGTLPSEIGLLTGLRELTIAGYQSALSGTIPPEIWGLSLSEFQLRYNNLEGTLPQSSVMYNTNSRIHLTGNHFYGEIPAAITRNGPEILYLNYNNFQGRVPAFAGSGQLLCDIRNNPELVCPFTGPSACFGDCSVDCSTNNFTVVNCSDPVCLVGGVETCYDPCVSCPKCVLNNSTDTYSCEWPPTPTPVPSPTPIPSLTTPTPAVIQSSDSVLSSIEFNTPTLRMTVGSRVQSSTDDNYMLLPTMSPSSFGNRVAQASLVLLL